MSGTDDKSISDEPPQTTELAGPKASHWLWQPWYAKLWWTTATMFWSAAFFTPHPSLNAYQVALLLLLFHPFVIVPVLDFGFFRQWLHHYFSSGDGQGLSAGSIDANAGHDYAIRRMDATDPAYSRYYGHPGNPTSTAWLDKQVRGKH